MTKQIGLWIDHKRAVILTLSDDEESMQEIQSGIDRHASLRGAIRSRSPYSAQYPKGDDQLDKQYDGYLQKFYEKLFNLLRGADAVLIIGPGEAKFELKKYLERQKSPIEIVAVESADKLTDRQVAAKIRLHFQEAGVRAN